MAHEIKKEWKTKAGYKAYVLYVNESHNCGYVVIEKEHSLFQLDYDKIPDIDVHGGITYAGVLSEMNEKTEWTFGFDAAHLGDKTTYSDYPEDIFRDTNYMANECESLAKQLKKLESKESE